VNVRAPAERDFDDVLALVQAADVALLGESDWTEQELREEWEEADLERNAWLVELDGRPAGYALLIDRGGGRLNADGYVHPDLRGRGVGSELLRLTEERARELGGGAANGRVVLQNATLTLDPTVPALYERHGYVPARHFFRMVIDLGNDVREPPSPEGVEIAPYDHPHEARAVHETVQEAFAREWNFRPESFEEFERRKLSITEEDKGAAEAQLADQFGNPKVAAAFPQWFRERLSGRNARAVAVRGAISGLNTSEASLRKYYEEHKADFEQVCLSHLLVETKEEADAALARVKRGESFAAVATAVSKDPGSAPKGGDLGCNNKGLFVPEFEAAAFSATPGVPTDPVQTQFGFHVLLVKERTTTPFEQAKFVVFLGQAAQKAKVTVDPRYGTFKVEPGAPPEVVPPETSEPAGRRPEAPTPDIPAIPGDQGTTPSTTQ
jgi:GNAT superfamily N-acetyltransferase